MNADVTPISARLQFANERLAVEETFSSRLQLDSSRTGKQRHLFVDNVRFWSMFAIVGIHSLVFFDIIGKVSPRLTEAATAPIKFGTIAFFLISGFLLGERVQTCRPVEYLGRRFQKVFLPWLCWLSLLVTLLLITDVFHHRLLLPNSINALSIIATKFFWCATTTAFWFVPNLFVGLCILILFRRHLHDLRLGAALLAVNLFYVINIYTLWVPSHHTRAVFGFVFHLWLGAYAAHHLTSLTGWISRIRTGALVAMTLLTCLISFGESRILDHLKSPDPCNTLRFSNQIFSITVVLLLLKIRRATWPPFIDVPRHTFGIYLSHSLVLDIVLAVIKRVLMRTTANPFLNSDSGSLLFWIVVTVVTYSICLIITKAAAAEPRLQWLVGLGSTAATPKTSSRLAAASELHTSYSAAEISFK